MEYTIEVRAQTGQTVRSTLSPMHSPDVADPMQRMDKLTPQRLRQVLALCLLPRNPDYFPAKDGDILLKKVGY